MAKAKVIQSAAKVKKKVWYKIQAPKLFSSMIIGETIANGPDEVKGRVISLSLMNLIGDIKKQNAKVDFKVKEVKGEVAYSDLIKYEVMSVSLKRLVRKGKSRIDDSFLCKTADNITVRVKPFILLNNKVKSSISKALRSKSNNFIVNVAKKSTYENFMRDVISGKLQRQISILCKTIYPAKIYEIRVVEIENPIAKKLNKIKVAQEEPQMAKEEAPQEEEVDVKEEELAEEKQEETAEEEQQ